MSAEWVGVLITALMMLGAVIAYVRTEAVRKANLKARDESLAVDIQNVKGSIDAKVDNLAATVEIEMKHTNESLARVEKILGNGHGLISDVRCMEKSIEVNAQKTEGQINEIRTRLSAQQHEINEIKAGR